MLAALASLARRREPRGDRLGATLPFRHDPHVDLRPLGRRVRLEFQFGLQCVGFSLILIALLMTMRWR